MDSHDRAVLLLRAVNVGGHRRLPMADLRALATDLGYIEPRTVMQSGNLVLGCPGRDPVEVASSIRTEIARRFGYDVAVVVRSRSELEAVVNANPLPTDHPALLHVVFLSEIPNAEAVARLDPMRSGDDEIVFNGREIYVRYAEGSARSALNQSGLERLLGITATSRNWNTVQRVAELLR